MVLPSGIGGWFDPSITGPGLHEVFYQTGDCIDTITILVQDIDAGPDLMFCLSQTNQPLLAASKWTVVAQDTFKQWFV